MTVLPQWARWPVDAQAWTVGAEEEVMLLEPRRWTLAQVLDDIHPLFSPELSARVTAETHAGALELSTGVHRTAGGVASELAGLRDLLAGELAALDLAAAAAGTHPLAIWQDTRVSGGARYQLLHRSMRELARREPTFALHVHVGVADAEVAVAVANRLRVHVPLLLALSANSPFWQGRDSGLASSRTPVFGAFPRTGIPRRFASLADWARSVAPLVDSGAIPEPTFLWWDVRLQPRFGTIEVRVMDAQTTVGETAALVALVQAVARLEAHEGFAAEEMVDAPEVLMENRFLATRDGMEAEFIQAGSPERVPARQALEQLVAAARPHAQALDCLPELALLRDLAEYPPAARQRRLAAGPGGLPRMVEALSSAFAAPRAITHAAEPQASAG
jgi:carboxylate-amine ligase